jgi:Immunoglobulin I-set domain
LKEEEKHPERKQSVSVSIQPLTVNFETSDLEIRAGQTLKLVIKVTGKSSPKQMTWYCNDQVIVASRKIKIDEQPKEGTITLTIPNVDQSNAGIYKMKAKNDAEEVSAEVTLQLLPSRYRGRHPALMGVTELSVTLSKNEQQLEQFGKK